jgi:GntR family transcriptional regulator
MNDISIVSGRINKNLPVPFYYQIVQILREIILDQKPPEQGEIGLPSENELCDIFQVNRGTIRHALEVLEREGLIYREKGRGTFLRRRRVELDPTTLCSTSDDLRQRGWAPGARLLTLNKTIPQPHIQRVLSLSSTDMVWEIYRLRSANNEPISLQWSYVPVFLAPDLKNKDLTSSLFSILKNEYRIQLCIADQVIRTREATLEEAGLLEIEERAPVFEITRITFDQDQHPVEYLDSIWRGDRYDLRVKLKIGE